MSPIAKLAIRREPKQQRSSEMVAKVCAVTLALLRERGLRNINTNLIAQEAGVDISSLYRFFANKEAILYHIAQEWLADIREVYDRYEQEPALLALDWRDYFDGLLRDWRLPGQYEKYAALAGLWHVYRNSSNWSVSRKPIMWRFSCASSNGCVPLETSNTGRIWPSIFITSKIPCTKWRLDFRKLAPRPCGRSTISPS